MKEVSYDLLCVGTRPLLILHGIRTSEHDSIRDYPQSDYHIVFETASESTGIGQHGNGGTATYSAIVSGPLATL